MTPTPAPTHREPTNHPSIEPSLHPTHSPTTLAPTRRPSLGPSLRPTSVPSAANQAPELVSAFADIQAPVSEAFSTILNISHFWDPEGDELVMEVALSSGDPLPSWLGHEYEADGSIRLSGIPLESSSNALRVTATDSHNAEASDVFQLFVLDDSDDDGAGTDDGSSGGSSGISNATALIIGILGGTLFLALLAWFILSCYRKENQQTWGTDEPRQSPDTEMAIFQRFARAASRMTIENPYFQSESENGDSNVSVSAHIPVQRAVTITDPQDLEGFKGFDKFDGEPSSITVSAEAAEAETEAAYAYVDVGFQGDKPHIRLTMHSCERCCCH